MRLIAGDGGEAPRSERTSGVVPLKQNDRGEPTGAVASIDGAAAVAARFGVATVGVVQPGAARPGRAGSLGDAACAEPSGRVVVRAGGGRAPITSRAPLAAAVAA